MILACGCGVDLLTSSLLPQKLNSPSGHTGGKMLSELLTLISCNYGKSRRFEKVSEVKLIENCD